MRWITWSILGALFCCVATDALLLRSSAQESSDLKKPGVAEIRSAVAGTLMLETRACFNQAIILGFRAGMRDREQVGSFAIQTCRAQIATLMRILPATSEKTEIVLATFNEEFSRVTSNR